MPVVAPTMEMSKRDAKFVAERLYPLIKESVEKEMTAYWHVYNSEKVLKELFKEVYDVKKPGEGYNYHFYEYNRKKYLLVGFLMVKLPNEEVRNGNYVHLRMNGNNFNFSQDELEDWLKDLFFILEMEDF